MTPDTMQRLAAETQRERLREAECARLAAVVRRRRPRSLALPFGESLGHLLAAQREVTAR